MGCIFCYNRAMIEHVGNATRTDYSWLLTQKKRVLKMILLMINMMVKKTRTLASEQRTKTTDQPQEMLKEALMERHLTLWMSQ